MPPSAFAAMHRFASFSKHKFVIVIAVYLLSEHNNMEKSPITVDTIGFYDSVLFGTTLCLREIIVGKTCFAWRRCMCSMRE